MPSWQAHFANLCVRLVIRRRRWGNEQQVARRARRLFGAAPPWQWLRTCGVELRFVHEENVRGEWIAPKASRHKSAAEGISLYIHGGGYVAGSPARHRPITAALARLSRLPVFSLDYRLAPEHRFPAALQDATAAYQWLLEQGVPASSMALAGDSAGGGLVLSSMLRARDTGLPAPSCGVCFSPWTDLAGTGESAYHNDGRCAMFHFENIAECAGAYLGDASPRDSAASPLLADLSGLPPLLLQVSSTELLLDDSRRLHQKIQAAGGVSKLEVFDGVCHCWQAFDGLVPEARLALRRAAAFMRRHVL